MSWAVPWEALAGMEQKKEQAGRRDSLIGTRHAVIWARGRWWEQYKGVGSGYTLRQDTQSWLMDRDWEASRGVTE